MTDGYSWIQEWVYLSQMYNINTDVINWNRPTLGAENLLCRIMAFSQSQQRWCSLCSWFPSWQLFLCLTRDLPHQAHAALLGEGSREPTPMPRQVGCCMPILESSGLRRRERGQARSYLLYFFLNFVCVCSFFLIIHLKCIPWFKYIIKKSLLTINPLSITWFVYSKKLSLENF